MVLYEFVVDTKEYLDYDVVTEGRCDSVTGNRRTLREWRARLFKTKQDMANLLNVHPSTYAKWENDPKEIKMVDVVRLIGILGCSIDDIIFFEKESKKT